MEKIESVLIAVEEIMGCASEFGRDATRQAYALKLVWRSHLMPSKNTYSMSIAATEEEIALVPESVLVDHIVNETLRALKGTAMAPEDASVFAKIPGYSADGWYDTDRARIERREREKMLIEATRKLAEEAAIASIKDTLVKRSQRVLSPERL